jgi:hypothetical protein
VEVVEELVGMLLHNLVVRAVVEVLAVAVVELVILLGLQEVVVP